MPFIDVANLIITDGVNTLITQARASQASKGLRASGDSERSLHQTEEVSGTRTAHQIRGRYTFRYQQNGRGPNRSGRPTRAQLDGLREWIAIRGVDIKALWPIAIKQAREGTKVPNPHNPGGVLSDVLNNANAREVIGKRLRQGLSVEIKSTLFGIV